MMPLVEQILIQHIKGKSILEIFFAHLKTFSPKDIINFGYLMKDALWLQDYMFFLPVSFGMGAKNKTGDFGEAEICY